MLKFDKALRNAGAASLAIKVGGMGLGLLATIMLARLLGPASYGEYAFVIAVLSLVSIPAQIGLPNLVVRETSKAQFEASPNRIRAVWKWANTVVVLLSLSLAAILLFVFWIFPIQDVDIMTLLLGLPLLPLIALGNIRGAALRGLGRVILGQIPETLMRPALIIIGLAAYAMISGNWTLSAPEAMFFNMVAVSVAFGFGTVFLLRSAPAAETSSEIVTGLRSKWLRSAMILGLMSGMQSINGNADLIMLGFFRTNSEVGTYRVAVSIASTASLSLMSLNVVIMPRIAQMHAAGELKTMQHLVTQCTRLVFGASLAIAVLVAVFGHSLLTAVFGNEYAEAYFVLLILVSGNVFNAFFGPVAMLLNMSGHEKDVLFGVTIAAAVNITLNFALIPPLGGTGGAIATATSLLVWNVLLHARLRKRLFMASTIFLPKGSLSQPQKS